MRRELLQLREEMARRGLHAYLIPTADFHGSEYVHAHFQFRRYISGFTGSAGTLVVTPTEAGLWTDGRYFLQAEQQLAGSGITLYRSGVPGTETIYEFLDRTLPDRAHVGVDGRTISFQMGRHLENMLEHKRIILDYRDDLAETVWPGRPPILPQKIWELPVSRTGQSRQEKLEILRQRIQESGANAHLITTLDDIAWLFNLRGGDIPRNPVFFSYCLLTPEETILFLYGEALSPEVRNHLEADGIRIRPYGAIEQALEDLPASCRLLLDTSRVSYTLKRAIPKEIRRVFAPNPTVLLKSIKNPVEISGLREANRRDGAAMVHFLCWLEETVGKKEVTELSAGQYLDACRKQQKDFLDLSFETIAGYGPHGAIIHYQATPETDCPLKPEGFLLVDSGGHYLDGTTDITRTIPLGPVTQEMKTRYTQVLRSMLDLAAARFPHGCRGENLDILARLPLWEEGLDYRHGTGHGIGFLLNVHEGPNRFHWNQSGDKSGCVLEPGMVTSDEPGYYEDGQFGIRIENDLLCVEGPQTDYGSFLAFEPLTLCPIATAPVDLALLTRQEREQLNQYHRRVWEELSGLLPDKERDWLQKAVQPI